MSDKHVKETIQQAMNHTLCGLSQDPFLTQRVLWRAANDKGEAQMKKKISGSLIFAFVMLRSQEFPRAAAVMAIVSGIFMIIPSTAGTIGLVFSLLSLIPWAAFLVFAIRVFLRLARA